LELENFSFQPGLQATDPTHPKTVVFFKAKCEETHQTSTPLKFRHPCSLTKPNVYTSIYGISHRKKKTHTQKKIDIFSTISWKELVLCFLYDYHSSTPGPFGTAGLLAVFGCLPSGFTRERIFFLEGMIQTTFDSNTPLKTNMAGWKITMVFHRRYIFKR